MSESEMNQVQIDEKSLMLNTKSKADSLTVENAIKVFDEIKCSEGKQCLLFCVTPGCDKHAVVCGNLSCKCNLAHQGLKFCRLANPRQIVRRLEKKRMSTPNVNGYLNKIVGDLVDWISQLQKSLESKIHNIGLSDEQKAFLELSYKRQFKELTGQKMSVAVRELQKEEQQIQAYSQRLKSEMERNWQKVLTPIQQMIKSLDRVINEFNSWTRVKQGKQSLIDSKVATTNDQREVLLSFFPEEKKPVGSKLAFRASEHNFSVAQFNQLCFGMENTVTLIKTSFDKVIGGFTPLKWTAKSMATASLEEDFQKESFVFSITNKDKLTIKNGNKQQVYHTKTYGPTFGGGYDIYIADAANANNNSYANIGHSYENQKYVYGNSGASFSGGTDNKFKILEWEVFQLFFKK